MKTLHVYLTRQVLASLLMTVVVFTFVLMLGSALKEVLPWILSGQVGMGVAAQVFGLLIPFVWVLALPMGMLTATLLIFGRFSADQELTAVRASGISLLWVASPILILSLLLCGVSALMNMDVGPRCRVAYRTILYRLGLELTGIQLPEGRFIRDFPGYIFYVGKNRRVGQEHLLENLMIFRLKDETNVTETVRAPRGKLTVDSQNRVIHITLYDGKALHFEEGHAIPAAFEEFPLDLPIARRKEARMETKISDMTFLELRAELRRLQHEASLPNPIQKLPADEMRAFRAAWAKQRKDLMSPVIFHMHRQVSFSFACFGFTLVGIPLAIRVHRRETNVGIAIALLLVAVYYSFVVVGHSLDTRPEFAPHLIVWIPNFLFQTVGAVLLWRANRGV